MSSMNNSKTYIIISCTILFLLISILSVQNNLDLIDQRIHSLLTDNTPTFVFTLMDGITKIGASEIILIATFIISILLLIKKMWLHIAFLFSVTFGGILLNFLLKILFQRQRPGEMSEIEVFNYSLEVASYSFPSGHTMRSVLLLSFLMFLCYHFIKTMSVKVACMSILIFMIILVSLSRVIVGAHFASDILAAVVISIAWFYFCLVAFRYMFKNTVSI